MMDRSFLSDPELVAASRDFVCVRLLTYENAAEGKLLESLLRTRSGVLENTVFAVLAPDGQTPLVRSGRSPREGLGPPPDAPGRLRELAKRFSPTSPVGGALPLHLDLRRALNAAACDLQPLALVLDVDDQELLPLAWSPEFIGRFAWARAKRGEAVAVLEGSLGTSGVAVVQPDAFGLKGRVLAWGEGKGLGEALAKGLKDFTAEAKDSRSHIDEGVRKGIVWKSEIPVTDPQAPKRR